MSASYEADASHDTLRRPADQGKPRAFAPRHCQLAVKLSYGVSGNMRCCRSRSRTWDGHPTRSLRLAMAAFLEPERVYSGLVPAEMVRELVAKCAGDFQP
jgi:hypothetical protein